MTVISKLLRHTCRITCLTILVSPLAMAAEPGAEKLSKVIKMEAVKWEDLNPARGDKSPRAGILWGDRTGPGPAGFLLNPADGFSSPPHIHNTAYRGVVIQGLLHNDDPNAAPMWMPAGSFWTQPAGEVHITAAKGKYSLAYIEVEEAFGVLAAEKAFQDKDRPVNVDVSNLVWVDQPAAADIGPGPKVAYLWGNPGDSLYGVMVRLPAGFKGSIRTGSSLRAVVIQGQPRVAPPKAEAVTLVAGSYFGSEAASDHRITNGDSVSMIYLRLNAKFEILP